MVMVAGFGDGFAAALTEQSKQKTRIHPNLFIILTKFMRVLSDKPCMTSSN